MRTPWLLALVLAASLGCSAQPAPTDAAALVDAPSAIDTNVDAPFTPAMGTCQPNGMGGRDCVGGPCPFPCCRDGLLATCSVFQGSECAFVHPIECGGGTCVETGACPDAGPPDAGP